MVIWLVRIMLVGSIFALDYYYGPAAITKQEQLAYCQAYPQGAECEWMRQ